VLRLAEVCGEVLVVIAPEGEPPSLPAGAHVRVVRDATSGQGPLAGLLAGLAEAHTEWALVAGGDMPELAPRVLRELLRAGLEARTGSAVLQDGDRYRPLPAALRVVAARVAAVSLLDEGKRSLRSLMEALPGAMIGEETWTALDPGRRTLFDVDEPSDLPPEEPP
jgi:molybdenum cofactor guanylyltransferase